MPQPPTKFIIGIKSSTSIAVGASCKVTNLSRESVTLNGEFKSGNECVLNPATSNVEWVTGDILMVEVSGVLVGSKQATLTSGGVKVNVTTATEDSIGVNL